MHLGTILFSFTVLLVAINFSPIRGNGTSETGSQPKSSADVLSNTAADLNDTALGRQANGAAGEAKAVAAEKLQDAQKVNGGVQEGFNQARDGFSKAGQALTDPMKQSFDSVRGNISKRVDGGMDSIREGVKDGVKRFKSATKYTADKAGYLYDLAGKKLKEVDINAAFWSADDKAGEAIERLKDGASDLKDQAGNKITKVKVEGNAMVDDAGKKYKVFETDSGEFINSEGQRLKKFSKDGETFFGFVPHMEVTVDEHFADARNTVEMAANIGTNHLSFFYQKIRDFITMMFNMIPVKWQARIKKMIPEFLLKGLDHLFAGKNYDQKMAAHHLKWKNKYAELSAKHDKLFREHLKKTEPTPVPEKDRAA